MKWIVVLAALLLPAFARAQPTCTSQAPGAIACQATGLTPQLTDILLGQQSTGPNRANQTVQWPFSTIFAPMAPAVLSLFASPPALGSTTAAPGNFSSLSVNGVPVSPPGGATTQVQFNLSGTLGADSTFTFNGSTKIVGVNALNLQTVNGISFPTGAANLGGMLAIGNGALAAGNSVTDRTVAIGYNAANINALAPDSIAIGYNAAAVWNGNVSTLGPFVAIGSGALAADPGTGDVAMTAIGWKAGTLCTACSESTLLGARALASMVGTGSLGGGFNTVIGVSGMVAVTNGGNNTTVGNDNIRNATTANFNTSIGSGALKNGLSISVYTALGIGAGQNYGLDNNTFRTAHDVAIGNDTMLGPASATTSCTGSASGACNTNSVAVGDNAGLAIQTGHYSTLIGDSAAVALTTGVGNTILGAEAGPTNLTTGGGNILLCSGNVATCDVPSPGAANTFGIFGGATAVLSCTALNTTPACNFPGTLSVAGVGVLVGTYKGNTTIINTASGAYTAGHLVQADSNGNLVDSGATAGAGTGIGTVNNGLTNNLAYYGASGTAVSPLATANSGILNTSSGGVPFITASPTISGTMTAAVFSTTGAASYEIGTANAISYPASDSTTGGTVAIGTGTLVSINGTSAAYGTTGVGYSVMAGTMTSAAVDNSGFGFQALPAVTSGHDNTAMGWNACEDVTTGNSNICVGSQAGRNITGTSGNIAIGNSTMVNNLGGGPGNNNFAFGGGALFSIGSSTATQNVGVGLNAATNLTTGGNNTAVGSLAMQGTSGAKNTGNFNTVFGASAGLLLQGAAASNLILGPNVASTTLNTGANNIIIGVSANADTAGAATSNTFLIQGAGSTAIISATGTNGTPAVSIPGTLTLAGLPTSCSGIGGSKQIAVVAGLLAQC